MPKSRRGVVSAGISEHLVLRGVLAGLSGLRVGEIAGLLWSDLDLARGLVTVSRTIEEDEDGTLVDSTKNGAGTPIRRPRCDTLCG